MSVDTGTYFRVLFDYSGKDGNSEPIKAGEECLLLKKTTQEWWCVVKRGEKKPVYVPANYMEELPKGSAGVPVTGSSAGGRAKKGPPPKPPVKPRLPKPSLEETVLKELDSILDSAGGPETVLEDLIQRDSVFSNREQITSVSDEPSRPCKSPAQENEEDAPKYDSSGHGSMDDLDKTSATTSPHSQSEEDLVESPTVSVSATITHTSSATSTIKVLHTHSEVNNNAAGAAAGKNADEAEKVTRKSPEDDAEEDEPDYINTADLGITIPSAPQEHIPQGDEPQYANLSDIQAAIHQRTLSGGGEGTKKASASPPPPPRPPPGETPVRLFDNHWQLFIQADTGRQYYFNPAVQESSWVLPRGSVAKDAGAAAGNSANDDGNRSPDSSRISVEEKPEPSSSLPIPASAGMSTIKITSVPEALTSEELPPGWTVERTAVHGELLYTNKITNDKWYKSKDAQGREYYYKEGASESAWQLPETHVPARNCSFNDVTSLQEHKSQPGWAKSRASWAAGEQPTAWKFNALPPALSPIAGRDEMEDPFHAAAAAAAAEADNEDGVSSRISTISSLASLPQPSQYMPPPDASHDRSQAQHCEMTGTLSKTKIVENGKKVKKNWTQSHVVISNGCLYFYKDSRAAQPKSGQPEGRPEGFIELTGAKVEYPSKEVTSRKYALQVTLMTGTQLLLQSESPMMIRDWYTAMREHTNPTVMKTRSLEDPHKKRGQPSQKHVGSIAGSEDGSGGSGAEKTGGKWSWLTYWLSKRPSWDSLKEKGIIKDERVFGSHLQTIIEREKIPIPRFVLQSILCVENRGLHIDGIYRVSGNLAQIQKLRFLVDHNDRYDLQASDWDVHVVAGALKLFFRELKEPLIPFSAYQKFVSASQMQEKSAKQKIVRNLVKELPKVNKDTLKELMRHLHKVMEYKHENRMEMQNIAIVFGPTLLWPESEGASNVAINMVFQGQVVEYLLKEFKSVFQ